MKIKTKTKDKVQLTISTTECRWLAELLWMGKRSIGEMGDGLQEWHLRTKEKVREELYNTLCEFIEKEL